MTAKPTPIVWKHVVALLVGCLVVIATTGYFAFRTRPCPPCRPFWEWLHGEQTTRHVVVGMTLGTIFGFVDNALLFLGVHVLDPILQGLPGGRDPRILAGYGNTFSGVVSAFVSTFIGRIVAHTVGVGDDDAPIWSMALGIAFGCVVGIALPMFILNLRPAR